MLIDVTIIRENEDGDMDDFEVQVEIEYDRYDLELPGSISFVPDETTPEYPGEPVYTLTAAEKSRIQSMDEDDKGNILEQMDADERESAYDEGRINAYISSRGGY